MDSVLKTVVLAIFLQLTNEEEFKQGTVQLIEYMVFNCTSHGIKTSSSCSCAIYGGQCMLCCTYPGEHCCSHYNCRDCLKEKWPSLPIFHITLSVVIFTVAAFFIMSIGKLCVKYKLARSLRTGRDSLQCTCCDPCCSCGINVQERIIIDRPPQYNDIFAAPPLYDSPTNRQITTIEAPPTYPGLSQFQTNSAVEGVSWPITLHV